MLHLSHALCQIILRTTCEVRIYYYDGWQSWGKEISTAVSDDDEWNVIPTEGRAGAKARSWKAQGASEWFKVVAGMGSWGWGWEEKPDIFFTKTKTKRAVNAKLRNLNPLVSREAQKCPEIKRGWSALLWWQCSGWLWGQRGRWGASIIVPVNDGEPGNSCHQTKWVTLILSNSHMQKHCSTYFHVVPGWIPRVAPWCRERKPKKRSVK